ncbi:hypothetical protein NKH10_24010 [Mesorhizobium sp. M1340]|uniref:hypothetical protein n=1 Tax=unclassified Mesorhizobium TaxID=325217 RepID=UPI0033391809
MQSFVLSLQLLIEFCAPTCVATKTPWATTKAATSCLDRISSAPYHIGLISTFAVAFRVFEHGGEQNQKETGTEAKMNASRHERENHAALGSGESVIS